MTAKVFALRTLAGIQRDGTVFDMNYYTDGQWVRFQRGRPRKMGGFNQISGQLRGPSRGMWVDPKDGFTAVYSGYNNGLQVLVVDDVGTGGGVSDFTLSNFTASNNNLWQFDGFYDVAGAGLSVVLAHPGQNLLQIDSTTNTPPLYGSTLGTTMSKIGVFSVAGCTKASGATSLTLPASDVRIGAGQTVTGDGIAVGTTVTSVSTTTVNLSLATTNANTATITFDNNISVSGGIVTLHPYVFIYGNDGLIKNCSAGDLTDWVSADANETNVATGKIVQGLPVRGGSNAPSGLFWSLDSLIRVSYIGGVGTPIQYWRYDLISSQSSILSSQSAIEYDGIYYWVGSDRFLMYNGVVKEIPNTMNQNYFFDNLNYSQRQKVWVQKVPRYGEIWWYYPRGNATECTDAVIYNVRENIWYDAGQAVAARRSAGYFSQVFHYPISASWEASVSTIVFTQSMTTTNASNKIFLTTYNVDVVPEQVVSGTNIALGTTVTGITTSSIQTINTLVGGTGYTNGTYTAVALTGGSGFSATANITVAGGIVTACTIVGRGAGYVVGNLLSSASIGAGAGFSVTVAAIYAQTITLSANATGSGTQILTFSSPANQVSVWQHEVGTNQVTDQAVLAIPSYFETSDLGLVAGGPSQDQMVGENVWLRIERVEPDFVQTGQMELYVTGRPFAQADDETTGPYIFDSTTHKIDMREQRRELRLRFVSNVVNGDYQLGKVLLNADTGDVRGY
jgi:hypothetical protein